MNLGSSLASLLKTILVLQVCSFGSIAKTTRDFLFLHWIGVGNGEQNIIGD